MIANPKWKYYITLIPMIIIIYAAALLDMMANKILKWRYS